MEGSEEGGLGAGGRVKAEAFVTEFGDDAALGGSLEVTLHNEIGFVDFLEGVGFFSDRHSERADADGAAAELDDDAFENAFVHFVEAVLVNLEHSQRLVRDLGGDLSVAADLGVVSDAFEQVIGDAGGAAAATGDFAGTGFFDSDVEETGGSDDDEFELVGVIVIESFPNGEPGQERGGEQSAASGRADEGESGEAEANAAGVGALIDDDVEFEVFHRGVEIFLDGFLETMDFVDEEDIAFFEIGEETGEIARFFDGWSTGALDVGAHGFGDDVSQGGFAQAGGAAEEHVIDRFASLAGGGDGDFQSFADFWLAGEVGENGGSETHLHRRVGLENFGDHSIGHEPRRMGEGRESDKIFRGGIFALPGGGTRGMREEK